MQVQIETKSRRKMQRYNLFNFYKPSYYSDVIKNILILSLKFEIKCNLIEMLMLSMKSERQNAFVISYKISAY